MGGINLSHAMPLEPEMISFVSVQETGNSPRVPTAERPTVDGVRVKRPEIIDSKVGDQLKDAITNQDDKVREDVKNITSKDTDKFDDEKAGERRRKFEKLKKERTQTVRRDSQRLSKQNQEDRAIVEVDWEETRSDMAASRKNLSARRQRDLTAGRGGEFANKGRIVGEPGLWPVAHEKQEKEMRAEVNYVDMPVIIPTLQTRNANLRIFGQKNTYMVTADLEDGVFMRFAGSRRKTLAPRSSMIKSRMSKLQSQKEAISFFGINYFIAHSEDSVDLSFSRFGCGYVMTIICDDPNNSKCNKDDYIKELVSSMALLNARLN